MPVGSAIAVPEQLWVEFIDTKTNQKIKFGDTDRVKVGGFLSFLEAFRVSPSGTRALALAKKKGVWFDLSTMTVTGSLDFEDASAVVFEQR